MQNGLTIDLEDYYHVTAFAEGVEQSDWSAFASRLEYTVGKLLDLFASNSCKATFFTLGWVAEKHPSLVRAIADAGHEIACHSYAHQLVYRLSPDEFRADTRRAQTALEDATGKPVRGYRAPSFSITKDALWAFEILAELGFAYDSSIFPVRHPNYGMPGARRTPFWIETPAGCLLEFPMPTLSFGPLRSPFGGGAYLRLLPYWYTRWAIGFANTKEHRPVSVYLHPWELDPEQPRMKGKASSRLRHYIGLRGTERKLSNLLRDFQFAPLADVAESYRANKSPAMSP